MEEATFASMDLHRRVVAAEAKTAKASGTSFAHQAISFAAFWLSFLALTMQRVLLESWKPSTKSCKQTPVSPWSKTLKPRTISTLGSGESVESSVTMSEVQNCRRDVHFKVVTSSASANAEVPPGSKQPPSAVRCKEKFYEAMYEESSVLTQLLEEAM